VIYIALFTVSFSLTYLIKNYYRKNAIMAKVNERSSHTIPTPHGGGIAIAVVWFVGICYLFYTDNIDSDFYFALMAGVIVCIVSYLDDMYELSAVLRIVVQSIVALLGLYLLGGLHSFDIGFVSVENQIFTNSFGFLLVVWYINLYNFLDGIDGYAGSEAIFLGFAGFILFGGTHFLVLIVAVLGFLYWNWHKAKIFMGDVGSTLLGYNIAVFTIYYTNQESLNLWIWIVLFGLFWFDATLTLIRRKLNGEKLSQAHKKHGYQRLTQIGWSHDKVVMWSVLVNIMLFLIVYFVSNTFVVFSISVLFLYAIFMFIEYKKSFFDR